MIIAGACAIEGKEFVELAVKLKEYGATHIRGGVFKPRSSNDRWQGLGKYALPLLSATKAETGLPLVVEAMSKEQIDILYPYVDIFQVGTRNASNSELLKELGRQDKPVILKRGMAMTIEEFVGATTFISDCGNKNIILCERGIRTFEPMTRNTFDLSCIPIVKDLCSYPIIADPSHAVGLREYVPMLSYGALSAGADGLMIEVHHDPDNAKTDGRQSLTVEGFKDMMEEIKKRGLMI